MCAEIHKKNLPKGRKFTYISRRCRYTQSHASCVIRSARRIYRQDLSTSAIGACERAGAQKIHHFLGYTYLHVVLVNFPKVKLPGIKWANSHTAQPNVGKYTIHGSYGVFVLSQMCFFGVMFDSFRMVSSPCWRISLPFFQPSIFAYLNCIFQEHLKQEWCLNIIASWKIVPFFSCALICVCCLLSIFESLFRYFAHKKN